MYLERLEPGWVRYVEGLVWFCWYGRNERYIRKTNTHREATNAYGSVTLATHVVAELQEQEHYIDRWALVAERDPSLHAALDTAYRLGGATAALAFMDETFQRICVEEQG